MGILAFLGWIFLGILIGLVCAIVALMLTKIWIIKYAEVDILNLLKSEGDFPAIYRLVEKKLVEKAILICWSAKRLVEKVANEGLIQEPTKNEILADISHTIEEIGKIDSLDGMPIGFLVLDSVDKAPKTILEEIQKFQNQQKKFYFMIRLFYVTFPYEIYNSK